MSLMAKRIAGHLSTIGHKSPGAAFSHVENTVKRRLRISNARGSETPSIEQNRLSFEQTMQRVRESDLRALKQYRPRYYPGKIRFVRPEANSYLPADPAAVWRNLAAELEVETVPGDHLGMITTHFHSLAEVLTRYVREAAAQ
jgi:thioesterase domain-containing protein